ncbi:hypothetical protein SMA5143A_0023 [Streptomyces sp. MA5143a]|nr:hypothetical protein SMA5143A_0023 [Streptomyces sp. MA5143a]
MVVAIAIADELNPPFRKTLGDRVVRLTPKSNIHSYGGSGEPLDGEFDRVWVEKYPSYPQAGRASGPIVSGRR